MKHKIQWEFLDTVKCHNPHHLDASTLTQKMQKARYLLSFRTRICDSQCAFLSWKILNTIVYISCITGPSLLSSNSTSDPKLRVILLVPQQFAPSSVIHSTYKISYDKLQNNCDTSGYPNENHNGCQVLPWSNRKTHHLFDKMSKREPKNKKPPYQNTKNKYNQQALTLVPGANWWSSSSGIITGHFSPASRNICSVSRSWPFSKIMVLMACAGVEVASKASSTPLTKVTVICGGKSSVRRLTRSWQAGLDSLALRALHWAKNSIHEATRGSSALNSIFTFERNFNIFFLLSRSSEISQICEGCLLGLKGINWNPQRQR